MDGMNDYLVGVRLRATAQADDYRVGDLEPHLGDLGLVEAANESAVGGGRRAKRESPGGGWRGARSARATRRRSWTVSDRAAASSAVPRPSGASIRSR